MAKRKAGGGDKGAGWRGGTAYRRQAGKTGLTLSVTPAESAVLRAAAGLAGLRGVATYALARALEAARRELAAVGIDPDALPALRPASTTGNAPASAPPSEAGAGGGGKGRKRRG